MIALEQAIQTINSHYKGQAHEPGSLTCKYMTTDGKKCIVGLFIPDGHLAHKSSSSAHTMLMKYPELLDLMPLPMHRMRLLQEIHDGFIDAQSVEDQKRILIEKITLCYDT